MTIHPLLVRKNSVITKEFIGVNTFGIRLRHELFDKWLNEKRSIEYVLEHLKDANFDPEFFKTFENKIISSYNSTFGTNLKVKQKSWQRILGLA